MPPVPLRIKLLPVGVPPAELELRSFWLQGLMACGSGVGVTVSVKQTD